MKQVVLLSIIFFVFFFANLTVIYSQVVAEDSLALIDFYHSTKGENWGNHENWLSSNPVSKWYGVVVENNRVVALQFGSGNYIRDSIPESIGNLSRLRELNLNYNYVSYIPESIGKLTSLKYLFLRNNQLKEIPQSLNTLVLLEEADFSGNYITKLPDSIGDLSNLKFLNASSNKLDALPNSMGKLINLISLNLAGNRFTEIPLVVTKIKGLKELNFGDNPIQNLPVELFSLDSLTTLWLQGDIISAIPAEIGNLIKLKDLQLQGNIIRNLPPEIGKLINLSNLDLSYNLLSVLPEELGNLKSLTNLSLIYNRLERLPSTTGLMVSLKELRLQHNFLDSLPQNFGELKNLSELNLDDNLFADTFPSQIGKLKNLTLISFRSNRLKYSVLNAFESLTKLKWVFLEKNMLESLPDFKTNTALTDLSVSSNRLTFEDIEPLITIPNIHLYYSPQDSLTIEADTNPKPGTFVTLSVSAGGSRNKYSWFKNGIKISNADSQYYQIKYTDSLSSGIYVCEITNPEAPELTLYSRKYWMNGINSTAVGERTAVLPKVFELNQNFPNPFNPSTTISYALPVETRVVLKIYSVDGREVRTLVNENQSAGYRSSVWDGRDNAGQNVSTGIYLYKIQAGNQVLNRKMLLLK